MPYEYDVFFSYKRDDESDEWHRIVMEKLKFWLKHELNDPNVSIFFDTENIRTGVRWQSKISQALKTSKTIVCLWSPLYFQSPWCISEWKSFAERECKWKKDLVVPASYHDGECFPGDAKRYQILDFSNYTSTARRFWDTESAVEFEKERLKRFAKDIAALVRSAPPFDPDFPLVEAAPHDVQPPAVIGRIADV